MVWRYLLESTHEFWRAYMVYVEHQRTLRKVIGRSCAGVYPGLAKKEKRGVELSRSNRVRALSRDHPLESAAQYLLDQSIF
jgi:hypothetical protein